MVILDLFVNDILEHISTLNLYLFIPGLTLVAVLRQVHPNEAMAILSSFVNEIFKCINNQGHGHPKLICLMFVVVLRWVHPGMGIFNEAITILNSFVNDISRYISTHS
ncbi:hypothetical protein EDB19DRAFT_1915923 [Suillus lakei]|nr:hypothetical protein EDB19DRAFT_1915923 [Suillus lakei]